MIAELLVKTGAPAMLLLASLHFRYYDVTADRSAVSYDLNLSLEVTADQVKVGGGFDLQVRKKVELFRAGQAREEALQEVDRNDYQMARKILNTQARELHKLYSSTEGDELLKKAIELKDEARQLDEVNICVSSRKVAKAESYMLGKKR